MVAVVCILPLSVSYLMTYSGSATGFVINNAVAM